jgi:hypothetical protein
MTVRSNTKVFSFVILRQNDNKTNQTGYQQMLLIV